MTKKLIALAVLASSLSFALPAMAETAGVSVGTSASANTGAAGASSSVSADVNAGATASTEHKSSFQNTLQIGPSGRVTMRGTIGSVMAGMITVKSWGGDWTVNVGASAKVLPAATNNDITKFQAGDSVGVQGTVSQTASWTIDATLVRDWTYRKTIINEEKQNEKAARELMRSEMPRIFQGAASAVTATSLTLTVKGTTYTVNFGTDAKILGKSFLPIAASSIQNGDTVRVWGTNANGVIAAKIVRDISASASSSVTTPAIPPVPGTTH